MTKTVFPAMFVLVCVGLAGCVDPMPPPPPSPLAAPSAASADEPGASLQEITWNGHLVVGAAYEAPAHFTPSENYVGPVWSAGFILDVSQAPTAMEVALDWTGADGTLQLMVHVPADHAFHDTWTEYATPMSGARHQCLRIADADLKAGHWYLMAHSTYGVLVGLTIKASLWDGEGTILPGAHGHESTPEELERGLRTIQKGPTGSEPCAER